MPDLDDRLRDGLRDAAREPTVDRGAVFERVATKRAHRRTVRQVRAGGLAVVTVLAVVVGSFAIFDSGAGDGRSPREVAAPGTGSPPAVLVVPGDVALSPSIRKGPPAAIDPLALSADEGYARGPLLASGDVVTANAYDRDGNSFTFPPSRIVRFDAASGQVQDRVDLQGEILQLSDGEGARWALTRDKTVLGPQDPEFRVKRIAADGSDVSNAVPPPNRPVGPIFAGGGAVWVPVADGVLRFDPASGKYAGKIPLPGATTTRRGIATIGKAAYVTNGATLSRLDPGSDAIAPAITDVTFPAGSELLDVVSDQQTNTSFVLDLVDGQLQVLAFDSFAVRPRPTPISLPAGFALGDAAPPALHAANGVVWLEGVAEREGKPVVVQLDATGSRVQRSLVLSKTDEGFVFTDRDAAVLTSGGTVYRITLS